MRGYVPYERKEQYNSFWRASVYNTYMNNHSLYKTIEQRHAYYNFAQTFLDHQKIESKWFQAAGIVTQWNAVGAAEEEGTNLWFLSDNTERFLREGNKFLFNHNMGNLKKLMIGDLSESFTDANGEGISLKGLSGKELDYALVKFEQTKVQEFTNNFVKNNPDVDMKSVFGQINGAFNIFAAPDLILEVMEENFDKGEFDFSNYDHRVILG